MKILMPGIDFQLQQQQFTPVINEIGREKKTTEVCTSDRDIHLMVKEVQGQAVAAGWQVEQLTEMIRILKVFVPCRIGIICRQSIEFQTFWPDGSYRGSNRYYNQRVKQPWNNLDKHIQ